MTCGDTKPARGTGRAALLLRPWTQAQRRCVAEPDVVIDGLNRRSIGAAAHHDPDLIAVVSLLCLEMPNVVCTYHATRQAEQRRRTRQCAALMTALRWLQQYRRGRRATLFRSLQRTFFVRAAKIVLARFSKEGRISANQGASDAGLSIVAFNRIHEAGNERRLHCEFLAKKDSFRDSISSEA